MLQTGDIHIWVDENIWLHDHGLVWRDFFFPLWLFFHLMLCFLFYISINIHNPAVDTCSLWWKYRSHRFFDVLRGSLDPLQYSVQTGSCLYMSYVTDSQCLKLWVNVSVDMTTWFNLFLTDTTKSYQKKKQKDSRLTHEAVPSVHWLWNCLTDDPTQSL